MQHDLGAIVTRIADTLAIDVTAHRVAEICKAVSFDEMKKNASAFAPGAGKPLFKSDEAFFSRGKNAQWHGVLEPTALALYARRMKALLPEDAIAWLENTAGVD